MFWAKIRRISYLLAMVIGLALLCNGCVGRGEDFRGITEAVQNAGNAEILLEINYEGTVMQGDQAAPFLIHAVADGAVVTDLSYSDWIIDVHSETLGETRDRTQRLVQKNEQAAVEDLLTGEWRLADPADNSAQFCPMQLFEALNTSSRSDGEPEDQTNALRGELPPETLRQLLLLCLFPGENREMALLREDVAVPATVYFEPASSLPTQVSIDCTTAAEGVAEEYTDRSGLQVQVRTFTITLTYSHFGAVAPAPLPQILTPDTNLF